MLCIDYNEKIVFLEISTIHSEVLPMPRATHKNTLTLQHILAAKERIKNTCVETKLMYSYELSKEFNNEIYLKPENLQITGSFKIRGALNKIMRLTDTEKSKGLIASSAGNHAQGVAYSGHSLGIDVTIIMPKTTPLIKVKATRNWGANVILAGDVYDAAYEEAKKLEKEKGYTFIHPFNDIDIMAGQGTIGLEILQELPDADIILVPIGGGGLISGIAVAAKTINPHIKVIGVESTGAQAMKLSMDSGKLVHLPYVDTIADGAAVKKPGHLAFDIIKDYVDEIITLDDHDLIEAIFLLVEKHKLVAEATGALSVAALKKLDVTNQKVVSVISGGNIDVLTMSSLLNHGLYSRGRLFCFSVKLKDTPGQLVKIAQILADLGANVVKLDHNQFKALDRLTYVALEVTVETNGHRHIKEVTQTLEDEGYRIEVIY